MSVAVIPIFRCFLRRRQVYRGGLWRRNRGPDGSPDRAAAGDPEGALQGFRCSYSCQIENSQNPLPALKAKVSPPQAARTGRLAWTWPSRPCCARYSERTSSRVSKPSVRRPGWTSPSRSRRGSGRRRRAGPTPSTSRCPSLSLTTTRVTRVRAWRPPSGGAGEPPLFPFRFPVDKMGHSRGKCHKVMRLEVKGRMTSQCRMRENNAAIGPFSRLRRVSASTS